MKSSNFENFSSLLHTDWHPEKGDFEKKNSQKDSELFNAKLRKRNKTALLLAVFIAFAFIVAMIFF